MSLTFLSLLISAISVPSAWTQAWRIIRKRNIAGISPAFLLMSMYSCLTWASYGLITRTALQIIINTSALLATICMITVACRCRSMRTIHAVTFSAIFIAGVATLYIIGPVAVGSLASTMAIGGRMPQIIKAWREPGGIAISIASFAITGTCSTLWSLYALLINNAFVLGTSLFNIAFAFFVIIRTVQGRTEIDTPSERESEVTLATA